MLQFRMDFGHTRIARERGVKCCQRRIKLGRLRQVSRCDEAGAGDRSAQFGRILPFDHLEERRLPRAIRANETDLLSVLNFPIEIFKNAFCAENKSDVCELKLYHFIFRYL